MSQDWATKAYKNIIETGALWADKDAAAKLLEDSKHSILAECKLDYQDLKSEAARETQARASTQYKDFLKILSKARGEANHARVRWEAAKILSSLRQTQESLKKAEFQAESRLS